MRAVHSLPRPILALTLLAVLTSHTTWVHADALTQAASSSSLPSVGPSLIRLLGAFTLVMALGLALLWFVRRGFRFSLNTPHAHHKLQVLEVRMLGNRQSLFVVGYHNERLLLASTPTGIALLTHLPPADPETQPAPEAVPTVMPSFTDALRLALGRKV